MMVLFVGEDGCVDLIGVCIVMMKWLLEMVGNW